MTSYYLPIAGASRRLVVAVALTLWSGCVLLQPLQRQTVGDLGYFEFRDFHPNPSHIVVGVPRGGSEPAAIDFAKAIRDQFDAGLVVAYDFDKRKIQVSQPLIDTSQISWSIANGAGRGSVYAEFRKLLHATVGGPMEFYIGVRVVDQNNPSRLIEVASAGISFDQLKIMKQSYAQIREQVIAGRELPRVEIALNPLDDISWNSGGVRKHGVLLHARRGVILRIPREVTDEPLRAAYQKILVTWLNAARSVSLDSRVRQQETDLTSMPLGRIDSISARDDRRGIVIGAPHGSFDWYTSELVEALSYRTSLPAVIARGFTPTECGGWRIDVNRPTERRYPDDTIERQTERAGKVYRHYSAAVLKAARGPLDLYIDMHQNSEVDDIDVATVGISRTHAQAIKTAYAQIRDRVLRDLPDVANANLAIEPVDQVALGAWAAKDHGILRLAKKSLHFEMPSHRVFYRKNARRAYSKILAELILRIVNTPNSDL